MRPTLFDVFGVRVAVAPVFAGLAALAAAYYFELRRRDLKLSEEDFWGLMLSLMLGVFAGSVGFYFIAYGGGWAGNVAFWRRNGVIAGGSFLGTFGGAAAAAALFCRRRRRPFLPVADVLAAAAPLGLVFMRVGCFLNGCCYGRPTKMPWGVAFVGPSAVPAQWRGVPLHPTQLYEAAGALAIFLILHFGKRRRPGDALAISVGLYGLLRFSSDFLRAGDPGVVAPWGLSLAQWAGAAAFVWAARRITARKA